jgi:MFS family permease
MPILFLIVFTDLVGFGLVIPLLPFYAERFAASPLEMTMLFATYSLMSMVTAPLWGRLSDRVGRRPVLMASMAAAALAYLWLAFATRLWMLFAARAFAGACAGNSGAAQAYIADVTPPERRAKGMGMIGAAFGLGFIIGPVLGGVIAGNDLATADLATPSLIAAGLSFAACLGVVFWLSESRAAGFATSSHSRIAAARDALTRPVLARLLWVFFLVILAFSGMETTFAWWAIAQFDWGPRSIGFVFFYVGLLSALMQGGLIGPLTRRFGEEWLMLSGLALIALGLIVLPFARDLPLLGIMGHNDKIQFDPRKYTWLGSSSDFSDDAYLMVVRDDAPAKTIEYMRTPCEPLMILGGTADGTSGADVPRILQQALGLNMKLVLGYRDSAAIFLAIERNEVFGRITDLSAIRANRAAWLKPGGGYRILLQFARIKRHPDFPDVPTARELAKSDAARALIELAEIPYVLSRPFAAPPGVPEDRATALQAAFMAVHRDAQYLDEAGRLKIDVSPIGGDEVRRAIERIAGAPSELLDYMKRLLAENKS